MDDAEIRDVIARHREQHGRVTAILEELQQRFRYLPEAALRIVARELDLPLTQVYGVATFFAAFSLEPKGEHLVSVCHGTTCHVKGAGRLSESLEKELQTPIGQTTKDGQFTLQSVRCLGCCSLAPVVSIDGHAYGRLKPETVGAILRDWRGGGNR